MDYEFKTNIREVLWLAEICSGMDKDIIKSQIDDIVEQIDGDVVPYTELTLIVNWKSWEWADTDVELARTYADKYYELREWAYENYKDDDLSYFYWTLD